MPDVPAWIQAARSRWTYRGDSRPSFADEPGDSQESVWDYPRPPRVESDSREVIVRIGDVLIARTRKARRVLETASPPTYYLPRENVHLDRLTASSGRSLCEWKGVAGYWSITLPNGTVVRDAAWSYEEPFEEFELIAGYISFYPSAAECYVAGERVRPQVGGLYGGWVTSDITGPFKGEPGTEAW